MERSYRDATLEELDILESDPLVTRLQDQARNMAKKINETGNATQEELNKLAGELDEKWPFMNKNILMTGHVYLPNPDIEGRIDKVHLEDEVVISNGFCFYGENIELDGEVVAPRYVPRYHIIKQDEDGGWRIGSANFDDVLVELPSESPELIEQRLRHFHAETVEQIDRLLANSANEVEAVLALSALKLRINPNDEAESCLLHDVEDYITHEVDFDKELPYFVNAKNKFFIERDEKFSEATKGSELAGYFKPERIRFLPNKTEKQNEPGAHKQIACVEGYFYPNDRSEEPLHVYLPSGHLKTFLSIRDM